MAQMDGVPPDAVVLGCTHYPLVADLFAEALPNAVEILDQPSLTVSSLRAYLERHPEFDLPSRATEQGGVAAFHTTGAAEPITRLATRFFGGEAPFHSMGPDPIPASLKD
jgi:glutamate racemase